MPQCRNYSLFLLLLVGGITPAATAEEAGRSQEDPIIRKARQAAMEFAAALPNFICQEMMSRFRSTTPLSGWQPLDMLTADLMFENGKEQYQKLAIDGKAVRRRMDQVRGAWSTGEFGSVLAQLFSPAKAAEFRRVPDGSRNDTSGAALYEFDVPRDRSQWMISVGDRGAMPHYRGSLRIEPDTGRVERIEMEACDLPAWFPANRVESTIDYQAVAIGTQEYFLPVHSEMLMCFRGENYCVRNAIAFANYRRYGSESRIQFADVGGAGASTGR
jgi:hypothetical protein